LALMSVAVVAALVGPMSVTPALAAHTTQVLRAPVGVPNPVPSSGAVQCSVEAVDSEQREMKYKWECDAGTFDDATLATPIWTAPANETPQPAQYTIKVAITTAPRGLETILGAPVATGEFVVTVQPQQAQVPPVDLQINSEWLVLSLETPNPFMLIEPIADRQCIACAFVNRTARDAPNVHVRFSAGPAAGPLQPIGNPVAVGLVEAGGSATATVLWNLQGANIENYRISAEVYIPDQQDINPADNTASITASIYYAYRRHRRLDGTADECWRPGRGVALHADVAPPDGLLRRIRRGGHGRSQSRHGGFGRPLLRGRQSQTRAQAHWPHHAGGGGS
jgi:hypothetical protein